MLILTRRVGEVIKIGTDIEITVMDCHNRNQVRIGIKAPSSVRVDREEIALARIANPRHDQARG